MPWMPGCPSDPAIPKGALVPIAVTLHRTYGQWPGDYSVGKNQGLFQFLIGQDDGQWVQFMSTDSVAWHCNGSNFKSFGIELTGTNEDVLTDWQAQKLGEVLHWAAQAHGIPLTYQDPNTTPPASVHVNDGNFRGVISHISVMTDDGSAQHTDLVTPADYARAVGTTPAPVPVPTRRKKSMFVAESSTGLWLVGNTSIQPLDAQTATWIAVGLQQPPRGPAGAIKYTIPVTETFISERQALAAKYQTK